MPVSPKSSDRNVARRERGGVNALLVSPLVVVSPTPKPINPPPPRFYFEASEPRTAVMVSLNCPKSGKLNLTFAILSGFKRRIMLSGEFGRASLIEKSRI
jgi:hypothetical protein